MPIYDLICTNGHRFEVMQPFTAELPACQACGAAARKIPSMFGIPGKAGLPPAHDRLPQTWRGTYGGNRDYIRELRASAEARARIEERHPELAGDRRPILAHEGSYETSPLRLGDTSLPARDHRSSDSHSHHHAPLPSTQRSAQPKG